MRIVIACDKFKGSLSAAEVAAALSRGLHTGLPDAQVVVVPIADGGDGTVAAALAAGFERVPVIASGPTATAVHTAYARRGDTAVVELACVCGLSQLPGGMLDPLLSSSFGVGEVLAAALAGGPRRVVLGIGGSASTDGGAGMLQALGASLLDEHGAPLARGGAALATVATIELSGAYERLRGVELVVASDVNNPLTGPDGAAAVYGPQKGATSQEVIALSDGLQRWAALLAATLGRDLSGARGAGAAGGVGFAALVLGAVMRSGIELVLDLVDLATALQGADLVITGEGSLDAQSLAGKAPIGVAAVAARRAIPVVAVAGRSSLSPAQLTGVGIRAAYPLTDLEPDLDRCMAQAQVLLERTGQRIARDYLAAPVQAGQR